MLVLLCFIVKVSYIFYSHTVQYSLHFCILIVVINIKQIIMRRKIWLLLLLIIQLFLSSCTEEDGKWEPMKWRSEVKKSSDGYYQVSPDGGTFVFQCKNYSLFWPIEVKESEEGGIEKSFRSEYNNSQITSIKSDWLTAKCEGSKLTVTIQPTTSKCCRFFKLSIEAGDVGDDFCFKQSY